MLCSFRCTAPQHSAEGWSGLTRQHRKERPECSVTRMLPLLGMHTYPSLVAAYGPSSCVTFRAPGGLNGLSVRGKEPPGTLGCTINGGPICAQRCRSGSLLRVRRSFILQAAGEAAFSIFIAPSESPPIVQYICAIISVFACPLSGRTAIEIFQYLRLPLSLQSSRCVWWLQLPI